MQPSSPLIPFGEKKKEKKQETVFIIVNNIWFII